MSGKVQIAPSLLACDLSRLAEEIQAVDAAGADVLHLDVMDGHFVPNITFGLPVIKAARKASKLPFDAHLMIENADNYISDFADAGCDWISVHVEACPHLHRTISQIKDRGLKAGVALNPATPISSVESILPDVDYVLVMSVNPGFGGQSFIPEALDKVRALKSHPKLGDAKIQIDGGMKEHNIGQATEAGAEIIVVGTGIFAKEDYESTIKQLKLSATQ